MEKDDWDWSVKAQGNMDRNKKNIYQNETKSDMESTEWGWGSQSQTYDSRMRNRNERSKNKGKKN